MQLRIPIVALALSLICGTSNAALVKATGLTASANGWDTRTNGWGCDPAGCIAENVLDDSIESDSRWSCRPSSSDVEVCELSLVFEEPQDIFELRMALFKGNQRTRTVSIWVDGVLSSTVETSGTTLEYEPYALEAVQATTIVLQGTGLEENVWLSITGVQLMTNYEVDVSSPVPDSDDYIGCYNDMLGDRVLTTVITDDAMTSAVCAAACGETSQYYYGLQQGNECWCAGCDITDNDTNQNFERHGEGSCSTPCAGDLTSTCGGDMAISLYQTTTCLATPSPTPAVSTSDCPSGSAQASLEIISSWEDSYYGLRTHVIEPGGQEVYRANRLGDVGMWGDGRGGLNGFDNPASESYLTLNGLSVCDDAVIGDYTIWATASEGTKWTMTARSGGELLWTKGGVFSEFQEETDTYTATVSAYAESDCTLDAYGECPEDSYSSDGLPPCTKCASGLVSETGSTYCTALALVDLNLPESIANAMVADAAGGWAGPGRPDLDGGDDTSKLFIAEGAEAGSFTVSGNFERDDEAALPASTALYLYIYNEDDESDFVRGQGVIDATTGDFTATFSDLDIGYSLALLSFVVLDPADNAEESVKYTVFTLDAVNEGCSDSLRVLLEWDGNDDLGLVVTEPSGDEVSYSNEVTDIGYLNTRNGGGGAIANPDTGFTNSLEEYVVFSGLSGDAMLGEYSVFVRRDTAPSATSWTLTATIDGAVVWVEEGVFEGSTSDTDFLYPVSDVFTIALDSYNAAGC